ncbi:MAG: hypothetical protein Q8Q33_10595 [Chlamydiota bacterium]|nr:hypothetical protein [Chlamydiota bacterium]
MTSLPFTEESAFLYHYAEEIAKEGKVPAIDMKAQYPEGFPVSKKITLFQDYVIGYLYRLFFNDTTHFSEFVRWTIPIFFSLGIFLVFAICRLYQGTILASILASLYYGLTLRSVVRSTGIEFVYMENFAFPLLMFHFYSLVSDRSRTITLLGSMALSISVCIWDGAQVYLCLWIFISIITWLFKYQQSRPHHIYLALLLLVMAGLTNPYLKDHAFIYSIPMMGLYCLCLMNIMPAHIVNKPLLRMFILIAMATSTSFMIFINSFYYDTYNHMMSLLWYKIIYLNNKPFDPELLPFDVRMLWTPPLHSATHLWGSKRPIYDIALALILSLPGLVVLIKRLNREVIFLLSFAFASFILYLAFVRLEVYLVFFLTPLIGLSISSFKHLRRRKKLLFVTVFFFCLIGEVIFGLNNIDNFKRPVPYLQLGQLVDWTRTHTNSSDVILANFGVSASILTYADRKIVLHPKYESLDVRRKTKEYIESLFADGDDAFYKFCLTNGVTYYVHSRGTYAGEDIYSYRYMANRMLGKDTIAAALFEYWKYIPHFIMLFDNGKHIVLKVLRPEDIAKARSLKEQAVICVEGNDYKCAESCCIEALDINPNDYNTHFLLAKVYKHMGSTKEAIEQTKMGLSKAKLLQIYTNTRE